MHRPNRRASPEPSFAPTLPNVGQLAPGGLQRRLVPESVNLSHFLVAVLVAALLISVTQAQRSASRPHFLGLAHVAFRVSDLDKTQAFYARVLGYEQPFSLNDGGGKTTTTFIKVNDSQYVELFQGDAQSEGQLDHFALYTDDLTAVRAYLQSLGMYIAKDTHRGRIGNPFLTIRDPDGHFIEILQYSPSSLTGQARGKFMPHTRISDHISHVGIVVSSLPVALSFYRDALGLREVSRGGGENAQPGWIDLRTVDGDDYVELISKKVTPAETGSQNHLGLATADVRTTVAVLQARDAIGAGKSSIIVLTGGGLPARTNILDPDGARLEIMEPLTAGARPIATLAPKR